MIYYPAHLKLWDTWLFQHPRTKVFHLFYLLRHDFQHPCPHIEHATSDDLINWKLIERITPETGYIGTGMVFVHDNVFYMSYTDETPKPSIVRFLTTDDAEHLCGWKAAEIAPIELPTDSEHYITAGKPHTKRCPDFRDACIVHKDGAYHAFIAATRPDQPAGGMGCIAHAVSRDLSSWEFMPPVSERTSFYQMEVPDYFSIGSYHYLFFSDFCSLTRYDDAFRERAGGSFYLMSETFDGPYRLPENPLILGSGCARRDSYVARAIDHNGTALLYFHHTDSAFGFPKRIVQAADGTLSLASWQEGIALLRQAPWEPSGALIPLTKGSIPAGTWTQHGDAIIGQCDIHGHHSLWSEELYDVEFSADIVLTGSARAGLVLRYDEAESGIAVTIDRKRQMCAVEYVSGSGLWHPLTKIGIIDEIRTAVTERMRLVAIARSQYLDVYLNDMLMFSGFYLTKHKSGQIGFFVSDGRAEFYVSSINQLRPLIAARAHPSGCEKSSIF